MINLGFLLRFKDKLEKVDTDTLKQYLVSLIDEFENIKIIFDSMSESLLVLDTQLSVVYFNRMAKKLLQITGKNPIGNHFSKVITSKPLSVFIKDLFDKDNLAVDQGTYNYRLDRTGGDFQYLAIRVEPLVRNGSVVGTILIINDTTREREQENRLRQSESLAALTTVAAGIAHEIKNPLGAMGIHVQLVDRELTQSSIPVSQDLLDSMNAIKEEIDRLNGIVVDFLYTVRPLKTQLDLVELNTFLDNFCEFIRPQLEEHSIKLIQNYTDLTTLWMDKKYIQHALLNLVQNSMAAIDEGGTIEIEAFVNKQYLYIMVIDDGPGIPEDQQSKIFDPYYTTKNYGTGLGLTIVYKIINEHKGQITFSSNPGQTIFTIQLPAQNSKKDLIEYRSESDGD